VEGTNTRNGDGRRLVLGFDARCMTCNGLAQRIEEAVGDRLEIRSLNDPMMRHWRRQALGENAPWAPTLIEVNGSVVRAWTGVRMGAHSAHKLGPAVTWRLAKILGEMRKEGSAERSPIMASAVHSSSKAWEERLSGCRCSRVRGILCRSGYGSGALAFSTLACLLQGAF
jgi:hypothetical protein